jgi:hypothetical protein
VYIYIYTYIQTSSEEKKEGAKREALYVRALEDSALTILTITTGIYVYIYTCIYIYIYTYIYIYLDNYNRE